ncbi:MAG TPA: hypothetical protein V6C78_12915 [Crinalium sp.]
MVGTKRFFAKDTVILECKFGLMLSARSPHINRLELFGGSAPCDEV